MECFHTLFSILTCGLCGSPRHDDGHTKPLLSDTDASRADRYPISTSGRFPPQPRAKKPVNTSNMLGLGIRDVNADYELGELVGEGAFGTVHRCVNRRSGQQYACKTVVKSQLKRRADVEDVRREVQILMMLSSHPNVAALLAIYEDEEAVHLILELCEGGQLFDEICARDTMSERIAARFFRKMVEVVNHCHTLGIAHRDIKPENFLLSKSGPNGDIKAADFGLSQFYRPGRPFKSLVGSAYFVAPEVLKREYGVPADIWSLGVCLYILLSGLTPFWGETEEEIFGMVLHHDIDFESHPWPKISRPGKDIVRRMLQRDPSKRPTASQLLQHQWLCQAAPDTPLGDEVIQRIKAFAAMTKVKRTAMLLVAQGLEDHMAPQITAMMNEVEAAEVVQGAGFTAEEARQMGPSVPVEVVNAAEQQQQQQQKHPPSSVAATVGVVRKRLLSAPELVAATLGTEAASAPREELVQALFSRFDPDGKGTISQDDLFGVLSKYGISREDVANVVGAVDEDRDGALNLAEFSVLMARNTDSIQEAVRRRWHAMESPQKRRLGVLEEREEEREDEWEGDD